MRIARLARASWVSEQNLSEKGVPIFTILAIVKMTVILKQALSGTLCCRLLPPGL